jgi:hypothetical protein
MQTNPAKAFQLNAEVRTVVEAHGLDWDAFRSASYDAYEQQLARHSPAQLDQFLTILLTPGTSLREMTTKCPPWPPNTEFAGAQPTKMSLSRALQRWNTARTLNTLSELDATAKEFRAKLGKLPSAQADNLTDMLCSIVSQELLAAKLEGVNVKDQTKALTQLLRKQKLRLDEKNLDLAREKYEFDASTACLKKLPTLQRISNQPKMSEEEKRRAIQDILFPKYEDQ